MSNAGKIFGWACLFIYIGIKISDTDSGPLVTSTRIEEVYRDTVFVEPHHYNIHRHTKYSQEPLPSEVSIEDQPRYDWIMDWDDYTGDWSRAVDEYESRTGDF